MRRRATLRLKEQKIVLDIETSYNSAQLAVALRQLVAN